MISKKRMSERNLKSKCFEDTQITLELEAEQEYEVFVDDVNIGRMTTNLGGKLVLSVELGSAQKHVKVVRV